MTLMYEPGLKIRNIRHVISNITRVGVTGGSRCHPYFSLKKLTTIFGSPLSLSLISLGCHPLEGVTTHLFNLSDLVYPLFFVNSATEFFFRSGVTPWKVSPGAVRPTARLVTPLPK